MFANPPHDDRKFLTPNRYGLYGLVRPVRGYYFSGGPRGPECTGGVQVHPNRLGSDSQDPDEIKYIFIL